MMGFLGNSLGDIANAALGQSSGTNLQSFLSKFYSSSGNFVDTIDPKTTFEVNIKFYPNEFKETEDKGFLKKLGSAALGATKNAVGNLANNITGGLASALASDSSSVEELRGKYADVGKKTFMNYLAPANRIAGGENWLGGAETQAIVPLELNLGPYVQEVTLPNIKVKSEQKSVTAIGEFPVNGTYVQPETNELIMQIVNTKAALHERIFYPWMREVTAPFWSYTSQPYTTADITIDFTKHNDTKYVFYGCRPTQIYSLQGNQDTSSADNLKRQVVFVFDLMTVQSDKLKTSESWDEELLGTGKALAGSAMHALNI